MTVTYTYLPTATCLINPGQYTIEQIPTPPNLIDGKASENGVVFPNPGSPQKLSVTVTSDTDDLINNDFGKLTAANPTVGAIVRIGVHRQKTQLIVPFKGAVNPVLAADSEQLHRHRLTDGACSDRLGQIQRGDQLGHPDPGQAAELPRPLRPRRSTCPASAARTNS